MTALLAIILAEIGGLVALGLVLFPWRRVEIIVVAVLLSVAAAIPLRRRRSRLSFPALTVVAVAGAALLVALCLRQYATNKTDNLPSLATTRLSLRTTRILRPYVWESDIRERVAEGPRRWYAVKGESPTLTFERHAMFPLDRPLTEYERTGKTDALQEAEDLALDWIDANSAWVLHPPSEYSWDSHATALRLTRFLALWTLWRRSALASSEEADLLERSILAHGVRLADSAFYLPRQNHGIDQDLALGQLAIMLDGPLAEPWYQTSQRRLRKTLGELISPAGITREHSPSFGLAIVQHLLDFGRFLDSAGRGADAGDLRTTAERIQGGLAEFVEPSGLLVPFGDTHGNVRPDPRAGIQVSTAAFRAFPEDGYAFIRETAGDQPPTYLAITAASNPRFAHKHCDDLSFVLSSGKRRLLADPAAAFYTDDEWRTYYLSCEAHNTASVGGLFQGGNWFAAGTGDASLGLADDHGAFVVITGSRRMGNSRQERAWIWVRGHGLVVVDHLTGLADSAWVTFHLGEGLRAESGGDSVLVKADRDSAVMRVRSHGPPPGWRIERGTVNPIQGWLSTEPDRRIPADVIVRSSAGPTADFVTEFMLGPSGTIVERATSGDRGLSLAFRAGAARWELHLGGTTDRPVLDSIAPRPR